MKKTFLLVTIITANFINLNAQSTSPGNYCAADFDDMQGFPVPDAVNSVSFGTLNNVTNAQFAAPHYVHYNNLAVPNFNIGSSYTLTVSFDVHGGAGYGVWIDYNHNNIFEINEKVSGTTGTNALNLSSNTIINETVIIPVTATPGNTRMRVRIVEDDNYTQGTNFSILPCNASTSATDVMDWGETEDYTINLVSTVGINQLSAQLSNFFIANLESNTLTLNPDFNKNYNYNISNSNGQIVQSGTAGGNNKQININGLHPGVYFIQVFHNNTLVGQQKFITSKY